MGTSDERKASEAEAVAIGHREPRDPFDAAEVHDGEDADDGDGDGFDGKLREVPLLNG